MAYTDIDNPELYFQTKLYTGNATDDTAYTLDGSSDMQPDWIWIKNRADSEQHRLMDSVRGASKVIKSSGNGTEEDVSTHLKSFDSNGFTLGTDNAVNGNTDLMVAWNWKAGTSFSNSAGANGASIASTGSINTAAGFSIIKYQGTGSNATVAHGLGAVPKMIIFKSLANAVSWIVYSSELNISSSNCLRLNGTNAAFTESAWNDTRPTASVFSLGSHNEANNNSGETIAYCFAEKQGYSKFGSYTGGGDAGTFVFTGFKPAWVMTKSSATTSNWEIKDSTRSPFNTVDDYVKANASAAEDTGVSSHGMDFLSNGFKHRGNNDEVNASGEAYIYLAFAESPFVSSSGVPATAR